jgi:large subunit ribosomal protein L24e
MVIKCDTCFYTENKIYPGHGRRLVRRDGRLVAFLNQKARSLYLQRIKAQRLTWTQAWRRKAQKNKTSGTAKKKRKVQRRVVRGIQGVSVEEIKTRSTTAHKSHKKDQAKAGALKAKKAAKPKNKSQAKSFAKVPKYRRLNQGGRGQQK